MNDITNIPRNVEGLYSTPSSQIKEDEKKAVEAASITSAQDSAEMVDIDELMQNDPSLKTLYEKMVGNYASQPSDNRNIMNRIMRALMELNETLQKVAIAYADNLGKITEKLNGYSKLQIQIPVLTRGKDLFMGGDSDQDRTDRGEVNQKFANMLEAIRANKGIEEDKAKKVNTILQSMKDAGQSASDFLTSFADLMRQIGSKICQ
jgi:hypothetical protein